MSLLDQSQDGRQKHGALIHIYTNPELLAVIDTSCGNLITDNVGNHSSLCRQLVIADSILIALDRNLGTIQVKVGIDDVLYHVLTQNL